jgi:cell wall-associated NlpC family hydrolase
MSLITANVNVGLGAGTSISRRALRILKKLGTNAHIYLPGLGTVGGIAAGNYSDAGTTAATVNGLVQQVNDPFGAINATQATAGNQPTLLSTSGKYSWSFNGTTTNLALGSIPFQMVDDHCVIAGARVDTAVGDCTIFRCAGAGANPIVGSLGFSLGKPDAIWRDDVTALSRVTNASAVTGSVVVIAARKVGSAKTLWLNGSLVGTDSTVMGTTTLTQALIGQTGQSTFFHNGMTGPILAIKGTVSDADILTLQRFVASLTPGATSF